MRARDSWGPRPRGTPRPRRGSRLREGRARTRPVDSSASTRVDPRGSSRSSGFARVNRADLWLAAVVGFSAGGQKLRQLRLEGLKLGEPGALAWVAIDAMHSEKPPLALHVQAARDLAAQARAGALTFVLTHTYIQPPSFTSTVAMARLATGWPLAMPPLGQTVGRSDEPAAGPRTWTGGLHVYSTGSTPADTAAHIWQARTLMPYVLGRHVKSLVESTRGPRCPRGARPERERRIGAAPVVPDTGSLSSSTSTPAMMGPNRVLLIGDSLAVGLQKPLVDSVRDAPRAVRLLRPAEHDNRPVVDGQGHHQAARQRVRGGPADPDARLPGDERHADRRPRRGWARGRAVSSTCCSEAERVPWAGSCLRRCPSPTAASAPRSWPSSRGATSAASTPRRSRSRARPAGSSDGGGLRALGHAVAEWWPLSLLAAGAFPTPSPTPAPALASGFSFTLVPGESIRDRIVRCCHEALDSGPMGQNDRHDAYKSFIAAATSPTRRPPRPSRTSGRAARSSCARSTSGAGRRRRATTDLERRCSPASASTGR